MSASGFLLARELSGEWTVLDTGRPSAIRQKFKRRVSVDNDGLAELFYTDTYGKVKRKVWRKRMTQDKPAAEDETSYTGEDTVAAKKVSRRRRHA